MKKLFLIPLFVICVATAFAQHYNTGSTEFDASLQTINTNANSDLSAFKLNISKTYGTPISQVESMFSISMTAGDIYIAFELGRIVKRPIQEVITVYQKHKGKGWGAIAKEMGIKPGSAEFHALKGNAKNKSAKGKSKGSGKEKHAGKSNGNGKGHGKNK
jgi:hypothetical protein